MVGATFQRSFRGGFDRLPEEVEEGYLGQGARARVLWLDPSDRTLQDLKPAVLSFGSLQPRNAGPKEWVFMDGSRRMGLHGYSRNGDPHSGQASL